MYRRTKLLYSLCEADVHTMSRLRKTGKKLFNELTPKILKLILVHSARRMYTKIESYHLHGKKDIPFWVCIETNSECTRHCYYCPRPVDEQTVLETNTFYSIIDQLREWGFRGIIAPFHYNEPLTDKRLVDLISYTNAQLPHSEIILNTNGDLIDSESVDNLLNAGVSEIKISLHEPTTQNQEAMIRSLKCKYEAVTLLDLRDGKREVPLSNRGGLIQLEGIRKLKGCYNIYKMNIRSNGDIVLCSSDAEKRYVFGNVKDGIQDIWGNKEYKELRDNIRKGKYTLPICKNCGYEY